MSNFVKLIKNRKNFIVFVFLKVLIMSLGLITNIFVIRKLSVEHFGVFSIVSMLIGLVTTFGFSWSSSSILYYGSREMIEKGNINKTFWARNIIILFSLVVTTFIFVFFRNEINGYIGTDVSLLLLFWLYISVTEDYLSNYFLAVRKQLLSSMVSLTAKLIYIILVLLISFDVKTLILLNIISHATVVFYIIKINKKDIGKFEFDKKWFNEILNFSIWQLFGFSGLYLINFGDVAVIKHYMTTEDVGVYNVAYKLFSSFADFAFVISSYFASSISTYFANKDSKNIYNFFFRERYFIIGISVIAHLFLVVFSKQIILTLYGSRYSDAIEIFNILMIGSIFRYISVFYMIYYNVTKKYQVQQMLNLIQAVLNLILAVIMINIFGLIGPAIATVISIVAVNTFSIFYCEKNIKKLCKL